MYVPSISEQYAMSLDSATPVCLVFLQFAPADLQNLILQNQRLRTDNESLEEKLQKHKAQYEKLVIKKMEPEQPRQDSYVNEKRRYRRRRKLQKNYSCAVEGCKKHYSSDMALKNHQRKDHNIYRRKLKEENQS